MTFTSLLRRTSSFSPAGLSGLAGWYVGDQLTGADAAAIAQWDDISGNARHATQGTAGSRPAKKVGILNGHAVARFDGSNDDLLVDGLSGTFSGTNPAVTIVAVTQVTSVAVYSVILMASNSASNPPYWLLRYDPASGGTYRVEKRNDANTGFGVFSGGSTADTTWNIISYVNPGTTFGVWEDGTAVIAAGEAMSAGALTVNQATIGSFRHTLDHSQFFAGDIAELLVYNRALTTDERSALEHYLGVKFSIVVA